MNDTGCVITTNFSQDIEDAIGKFVIAPTIQAQKLWEEVRDHPERFAFALGYTEDKKTGKRELMEISLVVKGE